LQRDRSNSRTVTAMSLIYRLQWSGIMPLGKGVIIKEREILGGVPVFRGTRVPSRLGSIISREANHLRNSRWIS
jgi:hypothetical protein